MNDYELRDTFAGLAMAALCASPFLSNEDGITRSKNVAKNAYQYAEAMMDEQERILNEEIKDKLRRSI